MRSAGSLIISTEPRELELGFLWWFFQPLQWLRAVTYDAGKISSHHEKQYFSPLFSWSGHLKHAGEDISARPEARGACSAWEPYLTQAVSFSWIHLCSAFLTLIWSCGVSYACLCVLEALATLTLTLFFIFLLLDCDLLKISDFCLSYIYIKIRLPWIGCTYLCEYFEN